MSKAFKKQFKEWVVTVSPPEARARLSRRGIGGSTVDQMVRGTYQYTPRGTNRIAIAEEMAKDGISLADEAS